MTLEQIQAYIRDHIDANTTYNSLRFDSMESAIDIESNKMLKAFNAAIFRAIDSETLEEENELNFLDESDLGKYAYFSEENECHVTKETWQRWNGESMESMREENDIERICSFIFSDMILDELEKLNENLTYSHA